MYKCGKEITRVLGDSHEVSVKNLYGSKECALNLMLFSCIPDGNTFVASFSHGDEPDDDGYCYKELKFDMHTTSVASCREFFKNQIMLKKAMGYVSSVMMQDMLNQYDICASYNDIMVASFDCLDSKVVPFEIIYNSEDEVVISAMIDISESKTSVETVLKALDLPNGYIGDFATADKEIGCEWCECERFEISERGIEYID